MSDELTLKVVAALRDMAAKVDEKVEVEEPDYDSTYHIARGDKPPMRKVSHERYDRPWLSGRLLGMADTIEALTAKG